MGFSDGVDVGRLLELAFGHAWTVNSPTNKAPFKVLAQTLICNKLHRAPQSFKYKSVSLFYKLALKERCNIF